MAENDPNDPMPSVDTVDEELPVLPMPIPLADITDSPLIGEFSGRPLIAVIVAEALRTFPQHLPNSALAKRGDVWTSMAELPATPFPLTAKESQRAVESITGKLQGQRIEHGMLPWVPRKLPAPEKAHRQRYVGPTFALDGRKAFELTVGGRAVEIGVSIYYGETLRGDRGAGLFRTYLDIAVAPNPFTLPSEEQANFWHSLAAAFIAEIPQSAMPKPVEVLPPMTGAFPDGIGKVPINPLIATGFQAVSKGGKRARALMNGWVQDARGGVSYKQQFAQGGHVWVYPNLSTPGQLVSSEDLWKFIEGFEAFDADVVLVVLAQICASANPMMEWVDITAEGILDYKGFRRRGEDRDRMLLKIHNVMERQRQLMFNVVGIHSKHPKTGEWGPMNITGDRFFEIVKHDHIRQYGLFGDNQVETVWKVRAGQWAELWLNSDARVLVGKMAQVLIALDHRENRPAEVMAKKIGQRILQLLQLDGLQKQAGRVGYNDLIIGNLLEDIGELPEPSKRTKQWGGRTREAFDEGIATLLSKASDVYTSIEWPNGYGPNDEDRQRGWVQGWLRAKIRIRLFGPMEEPTTGTGKSTAAPALPPPAPASTPKKRQKRIPRTALIDPTSIRNARTNISPIVYQEDLARRLGISRTQLSRFESGTRYPKPEVEAKIQEWLRSRTAAE